MEWTARLNRAIRYIEEHIEEEIDCKELAKICCCSSYHFQRMFSYVAEVSLSEYIRRRRMTLAAEEISGSNRKVIDVAQKYGYASPTAFNRAFQSVHGIAPSQVRKEGATIKAFPPLVFKMIVKGVQQMEYRIEKKAAFRIVGKSCKLERELEKNFEIVPKLWAEAMESGLLDRLKERMDERAPGILGVCVCGEEQEWRYYVAVASKESAQELESLEIPALTWAVFPGAGPARSIQELEQRIMTEWMPNSGYEYALGMDVEVYLNADMRNAQFEVWIPITKK